MSLSSPDSPYFIRGVNLGGWLVMERYITPYSFAVTDCHQRGNHCWYPGQIDAPSNTTRGYKLCDVKKCNAVLSENVFNKTDYPMDEWHMGVAFEKHPKAGEEWLNFHFDNFVKKEDILALKKAGITHLRVPLPHWIVGDVRGDEPYIVADRWKYFLRLCEWVREIGGMEIWPNLHTAPGSQNGFDNSGIEKLGKTCSGWWMKPENVQRTLDVLLELSVAIKQADVSDVVTGFGLLNEPFGDCDQFVYRQFVLNGITIMRRMLGNDFAIYISDLFQAHLFNDGEWGLDVAQFHNTFLDSHYYNVFTPEQRKMSPEEHIEQVCTPGFGNRLWDCCFYEEPKDHYLPSRGMQRIVAEWSAAFDAMPGEVLKPIMKSINEYGVAILMDRQLSQDRMDFLKQFIQAQIVMYEAKTAGVGHGWFYWNFKMEGGAFAEWDMCKWHCAVSPFCVRLCHQTCFG